MDANTMVAITMIAFFAFLSCSVWAIAYASSFEETKKENSQ